MNGSESFSDPLSREHIETSSESGPRSRCTSQPSRHKSYQNHLSKGVLSPTSALIAGSAAQSGREGATEFFAVRKIKPHPPDAVRVARVVRRRAPAIVRSQQFGQRWLRSGQGDGLSSWAKAKPKRARRRKTAFIRPGAVSRCPLASGCIREIPCQAPRCRGVCWHVAEDRLTKPRDAARDRPLENAPAGEFRRNPVHAPPNSSRTAARLAVGR